MSEKLIYVDQMIKDLNAMKRLYDAIALSGMIKALKEAPAVDAVEVVRCRDCKWFNHSGCAIFIVDDSDRPTENDFCSFGERRKENEVD